MKNKSLWYVPLQERLIKSDCFGFARKLMELDNVGFCLWYDPKKEEEHTNPDFIRRHLQLRHDTFTYIYAETKEEAIKRFYEEWEGAKIGGEEKEAKAVWIHEDRFRKIYKIADCPIRYFNEETYEFRCGWHECMKKEDFSWLAGCVLDQYDPPEDCPVIKQWDKEMEDEINV